VSLKIDENWFKLCEVAIARAMWNNDPHDYCDQIIQSYNEHEIEEILMPHLRSILDEYDHKKLYPEFLRRSRIAAAYLEENYPPKLAAEAICKSSDSEGWMSEGFVWKNRRTKIWRRLKKDGHYSDIKNWEYFPKHCCSRHFILCICRSP